MNEVGATLFGLGGIGLIVGLVFWAIETFEPANAKARRRAAEARVVAPPVSGTVPVPERP